MATLNENPASRRMIGVNLKRKSLSTKVDLTPMVDLGFQLITFFIFTTTFQSASVMKINLPDEIGNPTPVKANGTLTLLQGSNHLVYYYSGKFDNEATL